MPKRILCFGLLLVFAAIIVCAQNPDGSLTPDGQSNSSTDCADMSSASSTGCTNRQADEPDTAAQIRNQGQANDYNNYSIQPAERTSAPASENTTLGTQRNAQALRGAIPSLPPELPTEFQKLVAATTGQLLPIYGANLFRDVPSTFAPIDLAPVTENYVIGPEDQLRVRIWGQITYSGNLRVDRSGDIYLPQTGAVHVAGLPFSELDQHLRAAVARMYRNFDLSVDVGQIRSIQVYVAGRARRPGVYTVSSLSSLVDALFASGGPSLQGSLRHIQLKRDGKVVADFDLYDLLMRGDKSHDVRLLPEDVIYIAPVGPQAAITGSIASPAIYELRDGETIGDLLEAAGNTTALSSSTRISLERVGAGQLREAMEFSFDSKGLASPVFDGDVLRIYPILPAYQKTVTLRGNVANPGRFNWHEGMHLSDLIPDRDSLVTRDYWWKRSHLGLPSPEFEPLISTLGRNPYTRESTRAGFTTSVTQETLSSALTANNHRPSGDEPLSPNQIGNANSTGNTSPTANPSQTMNPGQTANNGSISSQQSQSQSQSQSQTLQAANQPPRNEVRLTTPEIDWDYAVIERLNPDTMKTSLIPFDLGKLVLSHDAAQDLALQPSDTITIFTQADIHVPLDQQTKYVDVEGEVVHAGVYSVQPEETLRDVIRRAGGFTSKAYLYGSEFDRESTRVLQQQRLDEYIRTLSMDTARGTQALAVSGTASGNADVAASRLVGQDLISHLSQIRATGRIVFDLQPGKVNISDLPDFSLENGDHFVVPSTPITVNVVGAVYNQNSFLYRNGRPVSYYLKLAGGSTRDADWRHSFIIRADGSVIGRTTVKNLGAWTKGFDDIRLNAGDSLVIPDKVLRPTALRGLIDTTQIFSQLALGFAAIHSF
jgi:protein involved in polysaccharide export with SLBB domain